MVRLVITDCTSREQNEAFYLTDEFAATQNMFTYSSFKKYSVCLSRYETNDEIYSLNLLSKKHFQVFVFYTYLLVHLILEFLCN